MNKIVVTGGTGFLGLHLVNALVEKGYDVHVIKRPGKNRSKRRVHEKATLHDADITNYENLVPIMQNTHAVFHLAVLLGEQYLFEHPHEAYAVNVDGTMNVLLAARDAGVGRVIYISSSKVYGDHGNQPLNENMIPQPSNLYAFQKYIGEIFCRMMSLTYKLSTVSLRLFNLYGNKLDPSYPHHGVIIDKFLEQKMLGEPVTITGDGEQTRDFVHMSDVVRALLLSIESKKVGKGEVINIGSGKPCSMNKLASLIDVEVTNVPSRPEIRHSYADIKRASELLDWKPKISIKDGLVELMQ